jgi:hypothetical protein
MKLKIIIVGLSSEAKIGVLPSPILSNKLNLVMNTVFDLFNQTILWFQLQ